MNDLHDRPLAVKGHASYRYRGRFGWIMIGAKDNADALREAGRNTRDKPTLNNLEVWNGVRYEPV